MSNGGGPLEDEAGHMGRWLEVLSKAKSSPQWPKGAIKRFRVGGKTSPKTNQLGLRDHIFFFVGKVRCFF